jgi:hypothetical protein
MLIHDDWWPIWGLLLLGAPEITVFWSENGLPEHYLAVSAACGPILAMVVSIGRGRRAVQRF